MTSISTSLQLPAQSVAAGRLANWCELAKPRMNLLILGTTFVGFDLAARVPSDWFKLPMTLLGTAFCAASAAILNQLIERRHDALMPRTSGRPLPTGRVSPRQALILGLVSGVAGGVVLAMFVNSITCILGLTTLLSYVALYTPLKRLTTLNTLVGAVPGAIPPVMGWTAVTGGIWMPAVALFAILFVWQIPHFLAIAILYREDYRKGGFKMLPVQDSDLPATGRQILIYSLALFPASILPSMIGMTGRVYLILAALMGVAFFMYAMRCAATRSRPNARKLFFASIIYLPVLLTILMMDRI